MSKRGVPGVLLAQLQDLHVPHVLQQGVALGDHLLQLLHALPQGQVVVQPTLLDLRGTKTPTGAISTVTGREEGYHTHTHTHARTFWVSMSWRMVPISLLTFSLCFSASCS